MSEEDKKDGATTEGETTEGAEEAAPIDAANPEAIARRVELLGEEDESERVAREEERKLAERRASKKKGAGGAKKKGGLEVAASKKLSSLGTRAEPKRAIAVAADADPLIERTAKLSDWARKNQKTVQIVGGLVAAGLLGVSGFMWWEHKRELEASSILTKAVEDQRARIGEPPKEEEDGDGLPSFKTYDERREAALTQYREVQSRFAKTGAAILARLAEGSMLLDKHDADGAMKAYQDVKDSPLAAADLEVKARALEGIGFAYELKAQATPADAAKNYDEALKTYKDLEATADVKGFKELAMYHQARVLQTKGEKDKAKELLLSLKKRFETKEASTSAIPQGTPFPYLEDVAMDRLREIDPTAAPKDTGGMPGGGMQMMPAQLRKLYEDMAKKKGGGAPPGGH